jgi:hypothetical protein
MSRKITIQKWRGNTDYSVEVEDNYGKLHHLGFLRCEVIDELKFLNHPNTVTQQNLIAQAEEIWENEVKPKEDLLANAIKECKEIDEKANRRAIL